MKKHIFIDGDVSNITFANIGELEELDINIDDINEESDIKEIMDYLDALYESSEIDLRTDVRKFTIMQPEDINYIGIKVEDAQEKEVTLDAFELHNQTFNPIRELLENAQVGDLIYLRKTEGTSNWELSIDVEDPNETLSLSYFDCTIEMDQYDVLAENYYSVLCDSILPESLTSATSKAIVENRAIEPKIVYAELYKVTVGQDSNSKMLERVDIPGYYFLDKTRNIDE